MGKFRSKLKGQTKGKRWAKGQSSSSNPETRKHRDRVKSKFFQQTLDSGLTTDALRKHDADTYGASTSCPSAPMDDETTVYSSHASYQTIQTFASEWSDCTNMSFNRFLKVFRSDSALHKQMLAVLAAVTEIIKQNGGNETSTEYFCCLVTTLDQILSADERNEEQVTAVMSLLNMGIKTVSVPVLRSTYSELTGKLLTILHEYCGSDNNVVIKSALGVLAYVLRNQELAIWTLSQTQQLFSAILNPFCAHTKPKWRKAAQLAALTVVSSETFESGYNPAATQVADFCKETLNACLGSTSGTVLVSSVQAGQTTILHTLGLLKETIRFFNKSQIKTSCEMILRLMSLNYPIVTSCSLQVLHSLFSSQTAVVPAKLNGQIITALYDYQPSSIDVQPTLAWLVVMQQAHIHLADVDLSLSSAALPKIFNTLTQLWLSQKQEVVMGTTRAIEMLLKDCVQPACDTEENFKKFEGKIEKCFQQIELGLGYQYNHAWHQVLHVISTMFEVGGNNCATILTGCLKTLSELRDSYKFSYNNELEHAVGAAIRSMGPETVLGVISLKKENGELNLDRSWMLPVLKENIRKSTLKFWADSILPLAVFCQKRSVELSSRNDGIGAHSSELLHLQLWNLLPSFCNAASDISTSFKSIARVLGVAISERKELRLAVMASLRKLIASAKDVPEDVAEITRFDKNYLPILFNLYTTKPIGTDEEGQRLAALDTIKAYLSVANAELVDVLFKQALLRLTKLTEQDEIYTKESILDLLRALLPYQPIENISSLYEEFIKNLPVMKNNKEQKKAYRLLEEICSNEAEVIKEFLKNNQKGIQKLLMKSLNTSAVSSKGARLRCLNYLVKAQPQLTYESNLIKSAIPEAVLCCKDINEKCRLGAYQLLNTIGELLQTHNQLQEFIGIVIAGLAGNPQLISCTILALASILHNFTGALGQDNIKIILENVLTLIRAPTREIVGSSISFVKVFMTSLPNVMLGAALPSLVKALCEMSDDCKRHFRIKVRNMLDRLIRKFGCDAITPHVPSTDAVMHKRLRNLRKLHNRQKRRDDDDEIPEEDEEFLIKGKTKTVEEILADSDSEIDDEVAAPREKTKTKSRKYDAFIEEDPDTIVDFKDPAVSSKITASKPKVVPMEIETKKTKDRGFKTSADGRLIIGGDEASDDSDTETPKKKKSDKINFDSDSDSDALSAAETEILRDRKRKRTGAANSTGGESKTSQYQPGGSGIHRKVAASSTASMHSGAGSEYRSKKSKGDMKKKGQLDPYAYLPLQRSTLNKRKQTKRLGQFKSVIGGAKSGAKKGKKAARRNQN